MPEISVHEYERLPSINCRCSLEPLAEYVSPELARARRYLVRVRNSLALSRIHHTRQEILYWEDRFLAALSWVWDAQERQSEAYRIKRQLPITLNFSNPIANAEWLAGQFEAALKETLAGALVRRPAA